MITFTSYRYVEVNMNYAALVWPLFNSLQAFWPGLQVKYFCFICAQIDIYLVVSNTAYVIFGRFSLGILNLLLGHMLLSLVFGKDMASP